MGRLRELGEKRGRKTGRTVPTEADLDWIARQMKPGEEGEFLGGFSDFETGMLAGAEGRKTMAKKGKGKKRAKKVAAAAADAAVAAVAKATRRKPAKKKRKTVAITRRKKSGAMKKKKKGGLFAGGSGGKLRAGSVLIDGLSVLGGAVLAVKANQMITARPFGLKPATIGVGVAFTTAIVMRKRNKAVARSAINVGLGMLAGVTIDALQGGAAPSGGAPSV